MQDIFTKCINYKISSPSSMDVCEKYSTKATSSKEDSKQIPYATSIGNWELFLCIVEVCDWCQFCLKILFKDIMTWLSVTLILSCNTTVCNLVITGNNKPTTSINKSIFLPWNACLNGLGFAGCVMRHNCTLPLKINEKNCCNKRKLTAKYYYLVTTYFILKIQQTITCHYLSLYFGPSISKLFN